jgi:type I restriction enzyme S subunit
MDKENKNIPQIRFKGTYNDNGEWIPFNDEWECCRFGDLTIRESKCNISSVDLPSVEYEDVIAEEGLLNKDISLKEVQKKGIIFDGSQVLYGKLRPYLHNWLNPNFMGVAVGDWWVLKPVGMNKNFIYRLIQTKQFDDVANQSIGSKMPRADWNLVSETEFMVSCSLEEQAKIGDYFSNLDHLISITTQELNGYKELKKCMLQKMFPKEGERVPEIRFPGFEGDWECHRLGEVTEFIRNGYNYKADGDRNHRYKITRIESISSGTINIERLGSSENINESYKLKNGDILFSHINSLPYIANTAIYTNDLGEMYHGMNLLNIRVKYDIIEPFFLLHLLKNENSRQWFRIMAKPAVNQVSISTIEVGAFEFLMPKIEEQTKIAKYFTTLDNLISITTQELNEYKRLKKCMLQKMFC